MSWVETELREQPEALARFLASEEDTARSLARQLDDVDYVFIVSRGSSSVSQIRVSALASRSISRSLWNGVGVMRRFSAVWLRRAVVLYGTIAAIVLLVK